MFDGSRDSRRGGLRRRFAGGIITNRVHRRQNNDDDQDDPPSPVSPSTPTIPSTIPDPARFTASGRLGLPPFFPTPASTSSSVSSAPTSEAISTTAAVQPPITASSGEPQSTATGTQAQSSVGTPSSNTSSASAAQPTSFSPGQGFPLRFTSTFSTFTRSATSETALPTDGSVLGIPPNPDGGQDVAGVGSGGPQPGAKAGIAVGSIAAAALIVSVFFFLWRRFQAQKHRRSEIIDSGSSGSTPQVKETRTDAEILRDLMATAHAHQNGGAGLIPEGYVVAGEKKTDSLVVPQAEIRSSIASWLRRHHPLQLNPMSDRNSMRSVSRCGSVTPTSNLTTPRSPLGPLTPSRSPISPNRPQLSPLSTQAPHHDSGSPEPSSSETITVSPLSNDDGDPMARNLTTGHPRAFPLV